MTNDIYEIQFVEHEQPFYQFGKGYIYGLTCERFSYSGERFQTGIPAIDSLAEAALGDSSNNSIMLETDSNWLDEQGGYITIETYRIEDYVPTANNEYFENEARDIIDFSEVNPFSETDRW